jgi:ABC-type antimicrobial peptide transport system permease subunit
VYGVTSFTVSQRTRDIGVRIALGSEPGAVVRRILAGSFRLTAIGLAVGLAVAIPASRLVASFLFQVKLTDPATWVATVVLVWLVGALAAYLPARRAAAVDPVRVLNQE